MISKDLYTIVDRNGNPVYTEEGMDGYFAECTSLHQVMTFDMGKQAHLRNSSRINVFLGKIMFSTINVV